MRSAGCSAAAGPVLLALLLVLLVPGGGATKTGVGPVTCGSVLKLLNTQHRVRLHSHDIKYGSGAWSLREAIARGRRREGCRRGGDLVLLGSGVRRESSRRNAGQAG